MSDGGILIVEDEAIVAKSMAAKLEQLGYKILGVAYSGQQAIEIALRTSPTLVLMDVRLRGQMDGFRAAQEIRAHQDVPIIFLTALPDEPRLQPFPYIGKPFTTAELHLAVQQALQ